MIRILSSIFLIMFISCTRPQPRQIDDQDIKKEWDVINRIEDEKWTKNKILAYFGEPQKRYQGDTETLIYNDKNQGYQNWAFEIKGDGSLQSFTFIPHFSNRADFTYDKIIKKWGTECAKKIETDLTQHFIRKIYSLDCGKNRHASLNRYDEVMSLYIDIE